MTDFAVVTPGDLSTDFELGTRITNKVSVALATSTTYGLVTLAQIASIASSNPGSAATTTTLGTVKIGSGLSIVAGLLSLNAGAIALTGGSINGVTIGASNPEPGNFTTLTSTGLSNLASITTGSLTTTSFTSTGSVNLAAVTVTGAASLLGNVVLCDNTTHTLIVNGGSTFNTDITYAGNLISSSIGSLQLPQGSSAQRFGGPGSIRLNTTLSGFEGTVDGSVWSSLSGGPTGGGTDKIFELNGQTITTNYTLPSGKNAVTAGPVTINNGITVIVPTGQGWSVV